MAYNPLLDYNPLVDDEEKNKPYNPLLDDTPPQRPVSDNPTDSLNVGIAREIERYTGLPADIAAEFGHSLLFGYPDTLPEPENASFGHKVARGVASLAGMAAPVGLVAKPVGLGFRAAGLVGETIAKRAAIATAESALTGAAYGGLRDTEEGESRFNNVMKDAVAFGAFTGAGGALTMGAARISQPFMEAMSKVIAGKANELTAGEKWMMGAVEYGKSMALGAGAGFVEDPNASITDRLFRSSLGALTFGGAHAVGAGAGKLSRGAARAFMDILPMKPDENHPNIDPTRSAAAISEQAENVKNDMAVVTDMNDIAAKTGRYPTLPELMSVAENARGMYQNPDPAVERVAKSYQSEPETKPPIPETSLPKIETLDVPRGTQSPTNQTPIEKEVFDTVSGHFMQPDAVSPREWISWMVNDGKLTPSQGNRLQQFMSKVKTTEDSYTLPWIKKLQPEEFKKYSNTADSMADLAVKYTFEKQEIPKEQPKGLGALQKPPEIVPPPIQQPDTRADIFAPKKEPMAEETLKALGAEGGPRIQTPPAPDLGIRTRKGMNGQAEFTGDPTKLPKDLQGPLPWQRDETGAKYEVNLGRMQRAQSEGMRRLRALAGISDMASLTPDAMDAAEKTRWDLERSIESEKLNEALIAGKELPQEGITEPYRGKNVSGVKLFQSGDHKMIGWFFATTRLADKYPWMKHILEEIINAQLEYNHRVGTVGGQISNGFDRIIKLVPDQTKVSSMRASSLNYNPYAQHGINNKYIQDNWQTMVKESSKDFAGTETLGMSRELKDAVRSMQQIMVDYADTEKRRRVQHFIDRWGDPEKDPNALKLHLLLERAFTNPLRETDWNRLEDISKKDLYKINLTDFSREFAERCKLAGIPPEEGPGGVPSYRTATYKDVQKIEHAINYAVKMKKEWGQDPSTYMWQSFMGQYKVLNKNGKIVGTGWSAEQAIDNMKENAERAKMAQNGSMDREDFDQNQQFILTSTLHDFLAAKMELKNKVASRGVYWDPKSEQGVVAGIRDLGYTLDRKSWLEMMSKAGLSIESDMAQSLGNKELTAGYNIKSDNFTERLQQDKSKFFGAMLEKNTNMKGDISDPLLNFLKYAKSAEKRYAIQDLNRSVGPIIDNLPPDLKNGKITLQGKIDQFAGQYHWEDRMLDEARFYARDLAAKYAERLGNETTAGQILDRVTKGLSGPGFLATRAAGSIMHWTSNFTLGYAPIKALVNLYGGMAHTLIKSSAADMKKGIEFMKTPEFQYAIQLYGHVAGLEQNFSGNEKVFGGGLKEWLKPLGMFSAAELLNRKVAFATFYKKSLDVNNGNSQVALRDAIEMTRITQGLYVAAARPRAINGPLGSASYQFKQYLANEQRFMKTLTPGQWGKYVAYLGAAGGTRGGLTIVKSLIGFAALGAAMDEMNNYMNTYYPNLHRGLPALLDKVIPGLGMDLSAPATWQLPNSTRELIGKPAADLVAGIKALGLWMDGTLEDTEKADTIRQLLPTWYNIYKGVELAFGIEKNFVKGTHLQQVIPDNERLPTAVVKFLGARSTNESIESDKAQYNMKKQQHARDRRIKLLDDIMAAKGMGGANKIIQTMQDENLLYPGDAETIRNAYINRQIPLLQNQIRSAPLTQRVEYYRNQPR